MNRLGIVAALAAEARTLGRAGRHRSAPALLQTLDDGTLVAVSGVGPEAAARGAQALVEAGAGALVSWGMAGGLDPALVPGTVLLPSAVVSRDGAAWSTAPDWRTRLEAVLAAGGGSVVAGGRLLSSAQALASVADKALAWRTTGAVAVDMESLAVAQLAATRGLPFVVVRAIVDAAADAVPQTMLAALGSTGQLQIGRLLCALALAPADVLALLRLGRRYRVALRALGSAARALAHSGALAGPALPAPAAAS